MCDLKIHELKVVNFRKFQDMDFTLNDHMNVFAGKNGSGKTAILEAATIILGAYLAAFQKYVPSRFVFNISKDDAHLKPMITEEKDILTTGSISQFPCIASCKMLFGDSEIEFQRVLAKSNGRTKFNGSNPMRPLVSKWEDDISQADHSDSNITMPLVLYLSSARLWNDSKNGANETGVYSRTEAYTRCLDAKHGMELPFSYIQMLQSVAFEQNDGKKFPSYEAILGAVNYALCDELSPGEEVVFSTRYESDIVALKTAEGTVVPFATLSDGYRNVIKIILDIATRMCILNPYLKDQALSQTPGIVIIDELDLSLHPTWQKRIVGILRTLFPKIQFICATHSPFVIQSLNEGELVTLDQQLDDDYSGQSIEDIAEDIMGVDMPQYSIKKQKMYQAAREYYAKLASASTDEDISCLQRKLIELEAEYSDNPAYLAMIKQELMTKKLEVDRHETCE